MLSVVSTCLMCLLLHSWERLLTGCGLQSSSHHAPVLQARGKAVRLKLSSIPVLDRQAAGVPLVELAAGDAVQVRPQHSSVGICHGTAAWACTENGRA